MTDTETMTSAAARFKRILPRYLEGKDNAGARKLLAFTAQHYAADPDRFVAETQTDAVRFVATRGLALTGKGWYALDAAIKIAGLEGSFTL